LADCGTSDVTETLGTGSDLWGTTWAPSDVNSGVAGGFGFQILVNWDASSMGSGSGVLDVKNYLITITYTPPSYVSTSFDLW
jgi:hypothetical protein